MLSIGYNQFYLGDAQDEIISSRPQILESNNVTGLTTGYGVTLGPKSNKLFTTNGAMRSIYIEPQVTTAANDLNFTIGDNGEIYNFEATDLTPLYTISGGGQGRGFVKIESKYYYLYQNSPTSSQLYLGQATDETFGTTNDTYATNFVSHKDCPPIVKKGGITYIGGTSVIKSLTDAATPVVTAYSIFSGSCQGIGVTGSRFYLYTSYQDCVIWDGVSTSNIDSNAINFPPRKIHQSSGETYATSRDGDLKRGNGWEFANIVKRKRTNRLEDNSIFQDKFNFSGTDEVRGQYITNVGNDIYVGCNDGIPGIYIYGNVIEGTPRGLHKAITKIHDGTAIDEIYAMAYDHSQDRVFYSYKAGSTYGIDYIKTNTIETAKDGYFVTQVWRGPPEKIAKSLQKRITFSNASGDNYIKLYSRINNGSWELLRDSRDVVSSNTIFRDKINNKIIQSKKYIDIQLKAELHNENQGEIAPIIHGLEEFYSITNDE